MRDARLDIYLGATTDHVDLTEMAYRIYTFVRYYLGPRG